jgi:hypothetical protein
MRDEVPLTHWILLEGCVTTKTLTKGKSLPAKEILWKWIGNTPIVTLVALSLNFNARVSNLIRVFLKGQD